MHVQGILVQSSSAKSAVLVRFMYSTECTLFLDRVYRLLEYAEHTYAHHNVKSIIGRKTKHNWCIF